MIDEEAVFAYIDGELEGGERARIEAAIAADPALQAMVAKHLALANRLHRAFSTVLDAPVPEAVSAAAKPGAEVVSLATERSRREKRRFAWDGSHWAAMAATLVAGVVGGVVFSGGHGRPVSEQDGQLVVSGRIELALNTQLASTQSAKAPVRIGLTFRNHGGAICRSFVADVAEGVACREGKSWQLQGLLARENAGVGEYRMAASSRTAVLVDQLIVGEVLDQAQERAALAKDWSSSKRP
ncbi:MAG: anti-sigma factor [Sphingomonas bacterium]|uniref:anti-sigma factor n=1 Tax=Sphingomonas bacterium TaxID=1895847 RepID=UPI002603AB7F|nr:anti-sigma factor [Sphingomonas bacterium]MDB5707221.1 anti-sigma factor [Sphingomonas bacterium]